MKIYTMRCKDDFVECMETWCTMQSAEMVVVSFLCSYLLNYEQPRDLHPTLPWTRDSWTETQAFLKFPM